MDSDKFNKEEYRYCNWHKGFSPASHWGRYKVCEPCRLKMKEVRENKKKGKYNLAYPPGLAEPPKPMPSEPKEQPQPLEPKKEEFNPQKIIREELVKLVDNSRKKREERERELYQRRIQQAKEVEEEEDEEEEQKEDKKEDKKEEKKEDKKEEKKEEKKAESKNKEHSFSSTQSVAIVSGLIGALNYLKKSAIQEAKQVPSLSNLPTLIYN